MSDLSMWLLGIGGYAGLAISLLFFNLYPNTYLTAIPVIVISPVLGAGLLYGFFILVSLWLEFTIMVFQSMLNDHLIFLMITSLFIAGEIALIGFILYKEINAKRAQLEEEAEREAEEEEDQEEEETEHTDEDNTEEHTSETMTDDDDKKSTDSMPGLVILSNNANICPPIISALGAELPEGTLFVSEVAVPDVAVPEVAVPATEMTISAPDVAPFGY